jgi:DNA-directed RNA polymerase subunit RPC12/RpoP
MLSDKAVKEFNDIFKKEYGQDLSDTEAREQGGRLVDFFEILIKQAEIEHRRKKRLEKEPKGFFLDANEGQYTCAICGETKPGNEIWWNLDGLRCADCWRNIQEKVIPPLTWDHDNKIWIHDWQIHSDYNVHSATARKLRRLGELHGRDLKKKDGSIYCTVYLVSENKEFFNKHPKKPSIKVNFVDSKGNKIKP